jgi:hypothetical protein
MHPHAQFMEPNRHKGGSRNDLNVVGAGRRMLLSPALTSRKEGTPALRWIRGGSSKRALAPPRLQRGLFVAARGLSGDEEHQHAEDKDKYDGCAKDEQGAVCHWLIVG